MNVSIVYDVQCPVRRKLLSAKRLKRRPDKLELAYSLQIPAFAASIHCKYFKRLS